MTLDPVLAEIRAVREANALRFKGDLTAMVADLRKRQQESGRQVVRRPPKRLVPAERGAAKRAP